MPIGWVEELEVLRMLDAQVLQCLSVGLMCWESYGNALYVSAIFPSEMVGRTGTCVPIGCDEV